MSLGFVLPVTASQAWIGPVDSSLLDGTEWETAAEAHEVDPWLLYAISLEESARLDREDQLLRPYPYTIHYEGEVHQFDTRDGAVEKIERLESAGAWNYDIGPLQINRYWHREAVQDPAEWLDVETSLDRAAEILAWGAKLYPEDVELAIGAYRSLDQETALRYAEQVIKVWCQLPGDDASWETACR